MRKPPFIGLAAVLLAGEACLALTLEGPALPFGPLLALGLLLAPGVAAALAQRPIAPAGSLVLCAASFGLTTLTLALTIALCGFRLAVLVPVLLGVTALGWGLGRHLARSRTVDPDADKRPPLPPLDEPGDDASSWPLTLLALICAAAVLVPFSRIGQLTAGGYAFRTYFDHDFLVHLSVVAELGKGAIPPQNPYFGGNVLHYYWLAFLYPALAQKLAGASCTPMNALILCNFATALLFAAMVYTLLADFALKPLRAAALTLLVLFCGSFEGLYVLARIRDGLPPLYTGDYNVDGVTRWYIGPPEIDALVRGLLYTHQHLWALSGLLALGLVLRRRDRRPVGGWVFALLLPLPGISGFIGLIAFAWVLCLAFLDATGEPDRRWKPLLAAALLALGLAAAVDQVLGMFGGGGGAFVQVLPRPKTWQNLFRLMILNFGAPGLLGLVAAGAGFWRRTRLSNLLLLLSAVVFVLVWYATRAGVLSDPHSYGPAIYLAALTSCFAGALVAVRERHLGGRDWLALCLIGLGAIVCGFIPGYVNEFGLRGGFVVALALGALIAALWRQSEHWSRAERWALHAGLVICAAAALPTAWIDLRNSVNLDDPRFITYISPREAEALEWIRRHVPEQAVVQGLPDRKQTGRGMVGDVINALGQRRLAVGKTYYAGQFQIGTAAAEKRVRAVRRVFRDAVPAARLRPLLEHDIGYLFVGPDERQAPHADPGFFDANPELFEPVFDNTEVRIFKVDRDAVATKLASLPDEAEPAESEPEAVEP